MEPPTKPMLKEAAGAAFYNRRGCRKIPSHPNPEHRRIAGAAKKIDYPRFAADVTFKRAPKARRAAEEQIPLGNGGPRRAILKKIVISTALSCDAYPCSLKRNSS
jgi:hypothetical protein